VALVRDNLLPADVLLHYNDSPNHTPLCALVVRRAFSERTSTAKPRALVRGTRTVGFVPVPQSKTHEYALRSRSDRSVGTRPPSTTPGRTARWLARTRVRVCATLPDRPRRLPPPRLASFRGTWGGKSRDLMFQSGAAARRAAISPGTGKRQSPHRSTSPNTMSCVPIMATTSASMWPLAMKSRPWRWQNPGARMWQRYGRLEPSDIR